MMGLLGAEPPVRPSGYAVVLPPTGPLETEEESELVGDRVLERHWCSARWHRFAALLAGTALLGAAGVLTAAGPHRVLLRRPPGAALQGKSEGCPGSIHVPGYGMVSMINAQWNKPGEPAGPVEVVGGVIPHMKGRSYFGSGCELGSYSYRQYAAIRLLGRQMRYTIDLSAAGCGCNAALYLTSLHQNVKESECSDYYCDANRVCGVSCAEIDIQEANRFAWYSTLHVLDDGGGQGPGYGASRRDWDPTEYGPGAKCIDTAAPFQVAVSFPVGANGTLAAMEVTLAQEGHQCSLSARIERYAPFGRNGMAELAKALSQGMTPIVSYWGVGENMLWMDGPGEDGQGPCSKDTPTVCGDSVKFYGFSVVDLPGSLGAPVNSAAQAAEPSPSANAVQAPTQPPNAAQVATAAQTAPSAAQGQWNGADAWEGQQQTPWGSQQAQPQAAAWAPAAPLPPGQAQPQAAAWAPATPLPPSQAQPQAAAWAPVAPLPPGQGWVGPPRPAPAPRAEWKAATLPDGETYWYDENSAATSWTNPTVT